MKRRLLGRTGLSISEIGFGGVEIGIPYGIGVEAKAEMPVANQSVQILKKAVELGMNFFDTARLYGDSERLLGIALKDVREQVVIATKCVHFRDTNGVIPEYDSLLQIINDSLNKSLSTLQTNYIDIFMVHYADMEILQNEDVCKIFSDLKNEGKVRHIGVSVYKAEESLYAVRSGIWDVIQLPFNLLDQSHSICFEEAKERGVGIIVRSVLMRGLLTDKVFKMDEALVEVKQNIEKYRKIAKKYFRNFPEYATKFALKYSEVSSVLVGIDKEEYLMASVSSTIGDDLSESVFEVSKKLAYPNPEMLNLAEWDKRGWL